MIADPDLEKEWRDRPWLTVTEAAKVLHLGRNTAYAAVKRGELPSVRFGGRILVPVGKLRAMFEEAAA